MPETVVSALVDLARLGEIVGAITLILGFVIVTVRFFVQWRTAGASTARARVFASAIAARARTRNESPSRSSRIRTKLS